MHSRFQLEDMDDLDYIHEEARNFDNDKTENHIQNVTKLNYNSYMNIQTRAKWSKSDTDLFYQVFFIKNLLDCYFSFHVTSDLQVFFLTSLY